MKRFLLFFAFIILVGANSSYAEPVLSKTVLAMPTLLILDKGTGSGFIGRDDKFLYLVTAKHVLFKKDKDNNYKINTSNLKAVSRATDNDQIELVIDLEVNKLNEQNFIRFNAVHDVAVIKIASIQKNGVKLFNGTFSDTWKDYFPLLVDLKGGFRRFDQVSVSNNMFIFGYPTSLGIDNSQIDPLVPLLRKGIVAGKNYKLKKK
jgi:hypothetical protein